MFGPEEWQVVVLSLRVALVASLVSLPFGLAVAMLLARCRFRGHMLVNVLVHLPLVLPPVVTGYLLLYIFSPASFAGGVLAELGLGLAFNWAGAALAAAIMGFPLMVRAMRQGIEAVDPRLEEAARTLGAPNWAVFATVTLPLSLPGIIAGTVLAFAKALGEFGATITFVSNIPGETRTIPLAIHTLLQVPGGEGAAWRLAGLSLLLAVGALIISEGLARRVPGSRIDKADERDRS